MIFKLRFLKYSCKTKMSLICMMCFVVYMLGYTVINFIEMMDNTFTSIESVEFYRKLIKGNKYILIWDEIFHKPITMVANGFQKFNCSVSNCKFTFSRNILGNYTLFDAIIFTEEFLSKNHDRPQYRSSDQLYVFNTIESPVNAPACELYNEGFFNWSFTPRLDSDLVWYYFLVRNKSGAIVAPSKTVEWRTETYPIDNRIRSLFKRRTKAAAWIVSHCITRNMRTKYLTRLKEHLYHYSLDLDVYGECNNVHCTNGDCHEMLKNNYYFYLAFENSFADDYVTEKVLHGYDNYVVPIVYGSANYTRFLPPNSYINATKMHPYNLAKLIYEAIRDPEKYLSFFYWTNFYTIEAKHDSYHPICNFCKALNSEKALNSPAKKDFKLWWNGYSNMKWCISLSFWDDMLKLSADLQSVYGYYNED